MHVPAGYMVYRNGKKGQKPRRVHASIGEALTEATKLAQKTHDAKGDGYGDTFLVVEVVGGVKVVDGKIEHKLPE